MALLRKLFWLLLGVLVVVNALAAFRYLLPHVPFPAEISNVTQRRIALSIHAFGGAIALLAGPLQFLPPFRERSWSRHRILGWIYCGAVLLGWCASLWIAPHAQTGRVASAGFLSLGTAWILTTGLAVNFILRGDVVRHRRWMLRSYVLTAAAITLRIYLPITLALHWPYSTAYPAIAWLCWIPNALAAEVYLHFVPTPSRIALPPNLANSSPQFR